MGKPSESKGKVDSAQASSSNPLLSKDLWLIEEGRYYKDGFPLCVVEYKYKAEVLCKKDGFRKVNSYMWENEEKQIWRNINRINYYR